MSSLTPKDLNQLSEETGLTKLSIQDWYKRFMHECPTGSLSKDRYLHLYRSYYPRARSSDSYAQMFFTTFDDDRYYLLSAIYLTLCFLCCKRFSAKNIFYLFLNSTVIRD